MGTPTLCCSPAHCCGTRPGHSARHTNSAPRHTGRRNISGRASADVLTYVSHMCRNITILRGLEPPATSEEITAAATQFVRKVTGVARGNETTAALMRDAEAEIASVVTRLLAELPPRRSEPTVMPPL